MWSKDYVCRRLNVDLAILIPELRTLSKLLCCVFSDKLYLCNPVYQTVLYKLKKYIFP